MDMAKRKQALIDWIGRVGEERAIRLLERIQQRMDDEEGKYELDAHLARTIEEADRGEGYTWEEVKGMAKRKYWQ